MRSQLTIGPVLFNWPLDRWLDFYSRIAGEPAVDVVYLGEVICSKRFPRFAGHMPAVADQLREAGKTVILSGLAEVITTFDRKMTREICQNDDYLVEANDGSALWQLGGRPHAIGPFLNIYNEAALDFASEKGARHICLPPELPRNAIGVLATAAAAAGITVEVQVYGRLPLALSARCYHARAHGRKKDNCRLICDRDLDGLELRTLENQPFLAINGIQTLSHTCLNLLRELSDLQQLGVTHFRLSPHSGDMIGIARLFRATLDGMDPAEACAGLDEAGSFAAFSNGFYHREPGQSWTA